jgi:uroporphyrinogen III methyltransferase/synthase
MPKVAAQPSSNVQGALSGRRIIVTRARAQAGELTRRIGALGGEVIEFPTIEIQPPSSYEALDAAIAAIDTYDWLIFTSVNGVEQFLARFEMAGKSPAALQSKHVAAIGPLTAQRLKAVGIQNCLVPRQYQAEGILEALRPEELRGRRVLIPRAAQAREILPETLRQWGAVVDVVEAYRTAIPTAEAAGLEEMLLQRKIDMITFTSSSTVNNFAKIFGERKLSELLGDTAIGCIGPITEGTIRERGGRAAVVSTEFTVSGLVAAMVEFFEREDPPS